MATPPNMVDIDTRTVLHGPLLHRAEDQRVRAGLPDRRQPGAEFFAGTESARQGNSYRATKSTRSSARSKRSASVLGQDQDNFVIVPLNAVLSACGRRFSLTLNILSNRGPKDFELAQDEATVILRARRHVRPGMDNDFFIGTKDSYISLWQIISGAFFAVFLMVSSISAVVGGIVIMNVMLVSVTERTKEIGVRRALGATKRDIAKQFLTESVMQCLIGGAIGRRGRFRHARLLLRTFTAFPASVQTWVAILGLVMSSVIGLFFGIYPAMRASKLDPVVALRAD